MDPSGFQRATRRVALLTLCCGGLAAATGAAVPKAPGGGLEHKAFFRPELYISTAHARLQDVLAELPNQDAWRRFTVRDGEDLLAAQRLHAFIDPRSGAATSIIGSFPLIPGTGVGNALGASAVDAATVGRVVRGFVERNRAILGIEAAQLGEVRAVQVTPDLWQVSIPQVYRGVPVRHGRLAASISHGNLVVIGTETWGNVAGVEATPRLSGDDAIAAGFAYAEGRRGSDELLQNPALEVIPVAPPQYQSGEAFSGPVGRGYEHRLVWSFVFRRPPEGARWEVLVDAQTGEIVSFQDINQYASRQVTGGAYPLTSTEICPDPTQCGILQTNVPMPFANTGFAAPNNFTSSAGVYDYTGGTATTTLSGRYIRMVDSCGAVSASSTTGAIALGGANGQHDCTTPGSGGAGNTAASRSGFYELNRLVEQARGWLPGNTWLQSQVTANMNLNSTCNAFYNGSSVNFYRSGGGCRNTGELAAVFDHEWGHGMDDNDAAGALSNSSEAYADIAAIYRLQASCVGHGFFWTLDNGCGQTADTTGFNANESQTGLHCATDCSGVRDSDWAKHADNTPDTALGYVCTHCSVSTGPCGRQVHCAAAPVRQAAWDLVTRDLTAPPFGLDSQTAFIVGNKLFYQGSGNVGLWHACTCAASSSGCGAANGYMQWITADDDNGNLSDGTPHMSAIFDAFNRHGIACTTLAVQNSGCSAGPSGETTLTATAGNFQVALDWTAVSGATRYWVFRSEGHAGCNFGKALIAETAGLSYVDAQVANGRTYYYNVVPAGASSACYGRAGACVNATPNGTPTPDFGISCSPSSLGVLQGGSGSTTCNVASTDGFNGAVVLSCNNLPAGVTCSYSPNPVTPPADGSTNSTLIISVSSSTAPGTFAIQAQGTSGALTRTAGITLTVTAPPVPDYSFTCSPTSLSIPQGGSGTSSCVVVSTNGFSSPVTLDCTGLPTGISCAYSPAAVTPPPNGSITSTVTVSAVSTTTVAGYAYQGVALSQGITRAVNMFVTVTPPGGGADQTAVFDLALRAPKCPSVGRSCDSGPSLLLGRDGRGPEPNQPNTINGSCADGTLGTFHVDESNDRIKVSTLDGGDFASGKTVRVDATVWAWSGGPGQDRLDLYYAANANSPSWVYIGTLTPPAGGARVLSATYTLPSGPLQAVRARYRYQGIVAACGAGSWTDHDDLVFAVTSSGPGDQAAAFDPVLQAPACPIVGRSCDSGPALLLGRDGKGPEPNQPNTINDSCADGTLGTYHADESNDRITVSTVDGSGFAAGKQVRIDATVWAWVTPTSDKLDLYYAANANSPVWTFIATLTPAGSGQRVLSATYTLPAGTLQAVRARFRYEGTAAACLAGSFDDHDDLVFAVQ